MSGSNKRSLNREELEIHQALSPASGSQQTEQQTEASSASNDTTKSKKETLTVDQLAMLIKSATAIGVKEGLAKSSPNRENVRKRQRSNSPAAQRSNSPAASIGAKSVDSDLPPHGLGVAHEETVTLKEVFGPNVNAAVTDSGV